MTPRAIRLLTGARQLISNPTRFLPAGGWDARDAAGQPVPATYPTAVRWTLHAALIKVAIEGVPLVVVRDVALAEITHALDTEVLWIDPIETSFLAWSLKLGRTHAETLALVDYTLEMAACQTLMSLPLPLPLAA